MEEQHAVPQDITGFQFKLVGDMTLKQFGELAFGAIMAYLFYASSWHPFLKWPLVFLFGFLGVALAFLPIEERPLDVWIANFFKAIYRPTYYVWKKDSVGISFATSPQVVKKVPTPPAAEPQLQPWPYQQKEEIKPASPAGGEKREESQKNETKVVSGDLPTDEVGGQEKKLEELRQPEEGRKVEATVTEKPLEAVKPIEVQTITQEPKSSTTINQPPPLSIAELEKLREQKLAELAQAKQKLQEKKTEVQAETYKAANAANIITVDKLAEMREKKTTETPLLDSQLNELIRENSELVKQIDSAQGQLQSLSGADKDILATQITALGKQKDSLAQAIARMQEQIKNLAQAPTTPAPTVQPPWSMGGTGQVRIVDKPVKTAPTIPLTDVPNIINGTVVEQRGGPLEGVILIVKDKAGNSVRALKTNRLGQFIASTPLENGKYYLEFELPNYVFNVYEIDLEGKVIKPLAVRGQYSEPKKVVYG